MRKLSKANTESSWAYMENNGTLEFNQEDTFIKGQGGEAKGLGETDVQKLHIYQEDAKSAFAAWKDGHISEIASQFSYLSTS